jgi:hypothetical protein
MYSLQLEKVIGDLLQLSTKSSDNLSHRGDRHIFSRQKVLSRVWTNAGRATCSPLFSKKFQDHILGKFGCSQ